MTALAAFAAWFWALFPIVLRASAPWLLPILSYALVGYGASLVHEAAGFIAVGALLWIELYTEQLRSR